MSYDVQLKMAANLSVGLAYATLAAVFVWAHSLPQAGHKRDLTVAALFLSVVANSRFANAWQVSHHPCGWTRLSDVMAFIAAWSIIIYIPMFYGHFAITLIRSEWLERIRSNKKGDDVMTNELQVYAAQGTLDASREVAERWTKRGIA